MNEDRHAVSALRPRGGLRFALLLTLASGCHSATSTPYERGRAAWEDQDYPAAAAAYEQYLATKPEGPEADVAELQLADIYYYKLKQYDRARDAYVAYLAGHEDNPSAPVARKRLAEVYVALGAPTEAIAEYERLSGEASRDEWRKIRVAVADLYFDSRNFSQAEIEYARVVADAPYDDLTEHSLLRTASIYHNVRTQHDRAIAVYDRIASESPDPDVKRQALFSLSEAYASMFQFDRAIAALDRIDDPNEAAYVSERKAELERQKREHQDAPEVDWTRGGKGESPS